MMQMQLVHPMHDAPGVSLSQTQLRAVRSSCPWQFMALCCVVGLCLCSWSWWAGSTLGPAGARMIRCNGNWQLAPLVP